MTENRKQRTENRKQKKAKADQAVNIVFYGVGGQGVLKASEVLGWAALFNGYHVKKTEIHGMAQRGGSVESHLRFGENVYSPLVPFGEADFLVCLHPEEYDRLKDMKKTGAVDLLEYSKKGEEVLRGNKRFLNTFVLGALSHYLPIKEENWLKALEFVFKSKKFEENKSIFRQGRETGGTL